MEIIMAIILTIFCLCMYICFMLVINHFTNQINILELRLEKAKVEFMLFVRQEQARQSDNRVKK